MNEIWYNETLCRRIINNLRETLFALEVEPDRTGPTEPVARWGRTGLPQLVIPQRQSQPSIQTREPTNGGRCSRTRWVPSASTPISMCRLSFSRSLSLFLGFSVISSISPPLTPLLRKGYLLIQSLSWFVVILIEELNRKN